ncbi:MAG: DUF1150 family protein [Paracoccaceae bacterium]|nr:DUF1150 family protein [Paracoccaceae bacterium]MDG1739187.1 DUF1150 family protein [Paracoccaceae bacterium]MDG2258238.1 DUF1150 family protein [Paracoccaceae bacterium]
MDTKFDFDQDKDEKIVYVRTIMSEDLPEDVRIQIGDVDKLYAVHNGEGERIALVKDRRAAFMLARKNQLSPVAVH